MKNLKRIASLMLALIIVLSMIPMAFAETTNNGTITINGVTDSVTYEIYQLLDLESYNTESEAYSYKVNSAWTSFFATDDAKAYMSVDEHGYATWTAADDDDTVAAFAKLALAYAKENGISPVRSSENEGEFAVTENTGVFSELPLGYYLVDSTMGALCGLTTTNPNASISAKNGQPTIDKQVKEDSTDAFGATNSADVGQIVEFRVIINVHAGAENYVLHDTMSAGLTFQGVDRIGHVIPGVETHELTEGEDYTVVTEGLEEGCSFEIRFTEAFCEHLETNDKVVVYYNAMLNRNAIVAEDGNPNETWLEYGEENYTTHDQTQTFTYGFDLVKTDSSNRLLDGAEFRIYDAAEGGNEVAVVLMDDGVTYRRARDDETGVSIVVKDGMVRVVGLDNGTYYLEETVTPAGYNQLAARQKFIISDGNLDAVFNGEVFSTGSGVHVVNKTGTMLPETGGIGTTLFYVIGGVLVAAAVVLLVTRKRMSEN